MFRLIADRPLVARKGTNPISSPKSTECAPIAEAASNCNTVIHVCHLAKYYPPATGGIETHVRTLARRQSELGARVTVVCVNHADAAGVGVLEQAGRATPATEELDAGIRVIRVARRFALSKWDCSPGLARRLRRLSSEPAPVDVFHLHTPNPTMTLAMLAAGTKQPLVVTHHSDVVKQAVTGRMLEWLERRLMKRAAAILATSPNYIGGSRVLQAAGSKAEVLPLGISLPALTNPSPAAVAARDRLRSQYPGPLWLSVGRLVYYKGIDIALDALQHVPGRLLIIGEGPLREELQLRAKALGVADRVVWLGRVDDDDLVGAYYAATAFWFPSVARSEAFGLVQVEAMATGCPVINTDIAFSGVPWVCPHDVAGLTIPVGDSKALAAAARKLLDEPQLRSRLAASGVRRAKEHFDADQLGLRSLELYSRVAKVPTIVTEKDAPPFASPLMVHTPQ
ncbi:MAG: glycosyltransferase [Planctomycetaceae bacterium]|nr:glycosyltransferase [Planctomycetaceae bacterium]